MLTIIFSLLATLHFAWALGMKWGFDASLPTNENGEKVLNPKRRDSLIVGVGLILFSIYYFSKFQGSQLTPNDTIDTIISWIIPSLFLLRCIGDAKFIGVFKKVKSTQFGKLDSQLIIPLCAMISILGLLIAFIN
ncbi:DUF3995 domain-containing protein [Ekhidna sp.]|uniref:DUF3995 domain-containing protein n=1 Tax=Ekhidna sp. TaxID=2608089 RepID=UPI003B50F21C